MTRKQRIVSIKKLAFIASLTIYCINIEDVVLEIGTASPDLSPASPDLSRFMEYVNDIIF